MQNMAVKKKDEGKAKKASGMGIEEQVGFHKGSIAVLSKERQELGRILQIVDQLLQMHVTALKDLGVDLEGEAKKLVEAQSHHDAKGQGPHKPKNKPPIEDII